MELFFGCVSRTGSCNIWFTAKVKVIAGLFKGENGVVTQLVPARERVRVLFEILGHQTEVEINEDDVDFPTAHPIGTE